MLIRDKHLACGMSVLEVNASLCKVICKQVSQRAADVTPIPDNHLTSKEQFVYFVAAGGSTNKSGYPKAVSLRNRLSEPLNGQSDRHLSPS